jgi:hypothetical protein
MLFASLAKARQPNRPSAVAARLIGIAIEPAYLRTARNAASIIGVRVKLDGAGTVTGEPKVVGMYTDCL